MRSQAAHGDDTLEVHLERLQRLWRDLPLARADALAEEVRQMAQDGADALTLCGGVSHVRLKKMSAAATLDQLLCVVYDVRHMPCRATEVWLDTLPARVAALLTPTGEERE